MFIKLSYKILFLYCLMVGDVICVENEHQDDSVVHQDCATTQDKIAFEQETQDANENVGVKTSEACQKRSDDFHIEEEQPKIKHKKQGTKIFNKALVIAGLPITAASVIAMAVWSHSSKSTKPTSAVPIDSNLPARIKWNDIFEYIVGTCENAKAPLKFKQQQDGLFYIQNSSKNYNFCCGSIQHWTLAELRQAYNIRQKTDKAKRPSFTVLCLASNQDEEADVSALQAKKENYDAVFQLASRMHGLEGGCVSGGEFTADGLGFNRMLHGPTQGETASFSATPGTIYKMYGYGPINLLAGTPFAGMINPMSSGGGMPSLEQVVAAGKDIASNWTDNLNLYFHESIDVVVGKWLSGGYRELITFKQRINQIPVAAFDWRMSSMWKFDGYCKADKLSPEDREKLRKVTGQMLTGFYEGTFLATVVMKKSKLFTTAVGGGAFQNDLDLIFNAIANDTNFNIIHDNNLEVFLVIHAKKNQTLADKWRAAMDAFWIRKDIHYEFRML